VLVTVLAIAAFIGRDAPTPPPSEGAGAGAGDTTLPAELEEALQRLEDSVRP